MVASWDLRAIVSKSANCEHDPPAYRGRSAARGMPVGDGLIHNWLDSRLMPRSKHRKQKGKRRPSRGHRRKPRFVFAYHMFSFRRLHEELKTTGYNPHHGPAVRHSFWSVVPPGSYPPLAGHELVTRYLSVLERELASIVRKQSLHYWIHAYRRLPSIPSGPGADTASDPLTRQTLEAAFRKYATFTRCDRIAEGTAVPESAIFDGRGNTEERAFVRSALLAAPQTVLTGFGVNELRELYEAEALAFDVWRSGAALRMAAKGASILVMGGDIGFADERTPELNRLVESVDKRSFVPSLSMSAFAVPFASGGGGRTSGHVLSATYNIHDYPISRFSVFLKGIEKVTGHPIRKDEVTRFIWCSLNIGGYMQSHAPFRDAFKEKHGVRLEAVVATIGAVMASAFMTWQDRDPVNALSAFFTHWRVAYSGPVSRALAIQILQEVLPHTLEWIAPNVRVDPNEVPGAFAFLELSSAGKEDIDLLLGGPCSVFLPDGNDVLIDHASTTWLLYYLLHGIKLPNQNFKALLLRPRVFLDT